MLGPNVVSSLTGAGSELVVLQMIPSVYIDYLMNIVKQRTSKKPRGEETRSLSLKVVKIHAVVFLTDAPSGTRLQAVIAAMTTQVSDIISAKLDGQRRDIEVCTTALQAVSENTEMRGFEQQTKDCKDFSGQPGAELLKFSEGELSGKLFDGFQAYEAMAMQWKEDVRFCRQCVHSGNATLFALFDRMFAAHELLMGTLETNFDITLKVAGRQLGNMTDCAAFVARLAARRKQVGAVEALCQRPFEKTNHVVRNRVVGIAPKVGDENQSCVGSVAACRSGVGDTEAGQH